MLSTVTVAGASHSSAHSPKLDGFQRCRPLTRSTYFDAIESTLPSTNGQTTGVRTSMPTLMPVMYALAR